MACVGIGRAHTAGTLCLLSICSGNAPNTYFQTLSYKARRPSLSLQLEREMDALGSNSEFTRQGPFLSYLPEKTLFSRWPQGELGTCLNVSVGWNVQKAHPCTRTHCKGNFAFFPIFGYAAHQVPLPYCGHIYASLRNLDSSREREGIPPNPNYIGSLAPRLRI